MAHITSIGAGIFSAMAVNTTEITDLTSVDDLTEADELQNEKVLYMCINSKGSNNPNRSKKKQLYFQKQLYSIYKVHENYNLGAYLYREPNLLKNRFINLEQRYYINIEKKSQNEREYRINYA